MPEKLSDQNRQLTEQAKRFLDSDSCYPQPCKHFKPTLEELDATTFSDYIRNVVLHQSERGYDDDAEEEQDDDDEEEQEEAEGGAGTETGAEEGRAATTRTTFDDIINSITSISYQDEVEN